MQTRYFTDEYKNYKVGNSYPCKITQVWYDDYNTELKADCELTNIEVCPPGNFVALYFKYKDKQYIKYLIYNKEQEAPLETKLSHIFYDIDILE